MHQSKPLYRKVNTRTRGVVHGGGDYRWCRHTKREKNSEAALGSMHAHKRHGLDYKPLFRFLLSKVGLDWDDIYRAAAARLDRPDPIFWLVARSEAEKQPLVRIGESAYFSGLFITQDNRLALVDQDLRLEDMKPQCACCTHTFNGMPYVRTFDSEE